MSTQYTKEQLWNLYKNLPEELKNVLSSSDATDGILNICENNGIKELYSEIIKLTTNVLLGLLPPDDFQATLEKELKLKKEIAKKASQEINRFVFYPVRAELEKLYQTKVAAPSPNVEVILQQEPQLTAEPGKEDSYREPVE